ncbi:MAG: tripartite tricarboxylate transporter substrate-binding protein, partial [Candidatus Puniceispirillaceae bacterium]
ISGVVGFIKSGDVRVLASFTDERIPGFEDIPTAKEQGIDVVAVNWRGLYTPKGASEASYRKWTEALRKVGASPEWKEAMMANGLAPFNKVGGDFQSYVDGVIGEVRAMSVELGVMK